MPSRANSCPISCLVAYLLKFNNSLCNNYYYNQVYLRDSFFDALLKAHNSGSGSAASFGVVAFITTWYYVPIKQKWQVEVNRISLGHVNWKVNRWYADGWQTQAVVWRQTGETRQDRRRPFETDPSSSKLKRLRFITEVQWRQMNRCIAAVNRIVIM